MKKLLALWLLTGSALAADSKWLLCDDGGLALNLAEKRLALIYGPNVFLGELKGGESDVVLKSADSKMFKGHVKLTGNVVTVNGLLDGKSPINAQLQCKRMTGGQ